MSATGSDTRLLVNATFGNGKTLLGGRILQRSGNSRQGTNRGSALVVELVHILGETGSDCSYLDRTLVDDENRNEGAEVGMADVSLPERQSNGVMESFMFHESMT